MLHFISTIFQSKNRRRALLLFTNTKKFQISKRPRKLSEMAMAVESKSLYNNSRKSLLITESHKRAIYQKIFIPF